MSQRATAIAATATAMLVIVVAAVTWRAFNISTTAAAWVSHTQDVINTTNELAIAVRDTETGQRGFLLTGKEAYLEPYRNGLERIVLLQGEMRRLTADNPSQQDHLRTLAPLLQQKLDEMGQTIQLRQVVGADAALAAVRMDTGELLMRDIRTLLGTLRTEEQALLAQRQVSAREAAATTRWFAVGGTLLALGLLVLAARMLMAVQSGLVRAEAEQRVLLGQMRTAFDSISQGIGVFDATFRLAHWNERFADVLDLPRPMMRLGTPYEAIAEQAAAAREPLLESVDQIRDGTALGQATVTYDRTRRADGRSFELCRSSLPDGGFVLTVTDTTERARAELVRRNGQRLQAIGQLTGGIAHDFNNLLQVVLGNLEMVQIKLEAGHPFAPRIERAIWSARRGAALTQHLLAFARRQPLSPRPVGLSAMLPDLTDMLRRTLGEHIELQVVDMAGLWPVMADAAQVESAVLNLALNARDAMPSGGRLTIEVANKMLDADYARQNFEVAPGDYVMLAVSDTGTGMPAEVLDRVFEPFFTTKDPDKGTGLGLSMVYGFAKQSGGHVKIYSEPGEGTTVRLYLPRAVGVTAPAPQRSGVPVDLPRGTGSLLLVVEDDDGVREVAVSMLHDLGYRVLAAANGSEALRVFGENGARIDMLLVDVILPGGMKGDEVARRISAICPSVRTLFMSGYTENAIVHHGRLDEGVNLIGKPFSRETLARKVAEVLGVLPGAARVASGDNIIELTSRERGKLG